MGYKCPKCGYERQPEDLAPEYECPSCGVIYEKAEKSVEQMEIDNIELEKEDGAIPKSQSILKGKERKINLDALSFLNLLLLFVFAFVFFLFLIGVMRLSSIAALSVLSFILWIWAVVECSINEPSHTNDKIVWIIIIIFVPLLGAILYLSIRKQIRKKSIDYSEQSKKNKIIFASVTSIFIFILFISIIIFAIPTHKKWLFKNSDRLKPHKKYYIAEDFFGCVKKGDYRELEGYLYEGKNFKFYICLSSGDCTEFKRGEVVHVEDTSWFWGLVKLKRPYAKTGYWTNILALWIYKNHEKINGK